MYKTDYQATVQKELSPQDFNNIIFCLKTSDNADCLFIRNATFRALKRLRIKRDLSKAITKKPKGSVCQNYGNFLKWSESITRNDTAAIEQLVAIDATSVERT